MLRMILLATVLILGTYPALAQTATPDPNALLPGVYQMESLTAPQLEASDGWVISSSIAGTPYPIYGLASDDQERTIELSVLHAGWIDLAHGVGTDDELTVTIAGTPTVIDTAWPAPGVVISSIPVGGDAEIVITGANAWLDRLTVHELFVETTPEPEPWIDLIYETPDGDVTARFEYRATAADVAIVGVLAFVAVSLWAGILLMIYTRRNTRDEVGELFEDNWESRDVRS
jgi:hypothetical protein